MNTKMQDVKEYWEKHPLLSYELKEVGSKVFFDQFDKLKKQDVEKFSSDFWEFNMQENKNILDVGCGPGWYTVNYARNKAIVYSIDLTSKAIDLTLKNLSINNLNANVKQGNAEELDFQDAFFDLVISSGVLHHTPNIEKAIRECFRVTKPGGKAKITLYHKGLLLSDNIFPIVKILMKLTKINRPEADISLVDNVEDFIRQYDGINNPVGIGKTTIEWRKIISKTGFSIEKYCLHFFPKRFIPFGKFMPSYVHYLLDKYFGLMIYFDLTKPRKKLT